MSLERSTQHAMLTRWVEPAGRRVVDVGCGSGELVRWLRSQGADAVGVECGEAMMRQAREADPDHPRAYLDGVAQQLPLPDASADAVVMSFSLHHVPRDAMLDALREAYRVLRPGGLLYVAEPISAGAGHAVVSLIDDETEVRIFAQEVLAQAPSLGFEPMLETMYASRMLLDSAEGFARRIVGIDPRRAARMAERHAEFVETFERLAEQVDGKFAFDQQVRVKLLRKPWPPKTSSRSNAPSSSRRAELEAEGGAAMDTSEKNANASVTRREMLGALAVMGAGAAMASGLDADSAMAEEAQSEGPPAYRGKHSPRPLPFDPTKLPGLSERLLLSHHANNYGGAVKRLNLIQQQLGLLPPDAAPYQVGSLKREELIAANSMRLHELYFANLGGSGRPDGTAASLLKAEYGSLERWEHDFRQTALSLGGGSGWVVVGYDPASRSLHDWWAWDHTHQLVAGVPVLVLDLYEHAYAMDYGASTNAYLDAFLANVQWDEVNRRVERVHAAKTS